MTICANCQRDNELARAAITVAIIKGDGRLHIGEREKEDFERSKEALKHIIPVRFWKGGTLTAVVDCVDPSYAAKMKAAPDGPIAEIDPPKAYHIIPEAKHWIHPVDAMGLEELRLLREKINERIYDLERGR